MSKKVMHVLGARPNFPKAAPVVQGLDDLGISQTVVHTGQHYDHKLSEVFFEQLGLPRPDVNFGVGSGSHGAQTAAVMVAIEEFLEKEDIDLVIVYGDVNSTVATALVASKMHIPVAHVEAGLRSFDREMPEELNRIVTDTLSDLLLTTSPDANSNLGNEGIHPDKIHFVGNPMIDSLLKNLELYDDGFARKVLDIEGDYIVATIHRPSNVDDLEDAKEVVRALHQVADSTSIVVPLHPRGRVNLLAAGLDDHANVTVIDPLGYIEFMGLVRGSSGVITDSGGVQEETTILRVPCFTLRDNTERPITISHGTNVLTNTSDLAADVARANTASSQKIDEVPPLWDGQAGARIARIVDQFLSNNQSL